MRILVLIAATFFSPLAFVPQARSQSISGPTQDELSRAHESTTDWLHPGHDYAGRRYVQLSQITPGNAHGLRPVCAYQAAVPAAFHTNPLVYRTVMYLTTRFETLALDARTCRLRWKRHHYPKGGTVMANRGVAIKDGKVIRGTADGRLIAMDALTGEVLWERQQGDPDGGKVFNMPPLIYEDVVIIGIMAGGLGVRGWIGGFRLSDGEPLWRFYVVPRLGEPGAETWGDSTVLADGGGGVWTPITLDVETGLVFVGTTDPAPVFDGSTRPGDNLFTNSLVVLDARTGKLAWYRQLVRHDELDRGVTSPGPLFEATIEGRRRPLVATAGKDGMLRVIDRNTHGIVYEIPVTTMLNPTARPTPEGVRVCPGITGGVEWNGPAYSPRTGMLYVAAVDRCTTYYSGRDPSKGSSDFWAGRVVADPIEKEKGWLTAVDASTGEVRWRYASDAPMVGAVSATSGDVVFTGEVSGDFLALDARDGDVLYRFNTGGAVAGGVITYGIEGKQYVAAMSGGMTRFWQRPGGTATVFIFALP